MSPINRDARRDERITTDIIADANGPEEQAMGWYAYLEDQLHFPFLAKCIAGRAISPLRKGDEVEILGMGPESECQHEMFVETRWGKGTLAVPLAQVKPIAKTDDETQEAVADWHYWMARGYEL
jgi:hypothetical protein